MRSRPSWRAWRHSEPAASPGSGLHQQPWTRTDAPRALDRSARWPEREPRVVVVRGTQATPWELRPWGELADRFDVSFLSSSATQFGGGDVGIDPVPVRTRLPGGRMGDMARSLVGDRHVGADDALRGADIVHAEELGYWFAGDVARRKAQFGYRLVQTVWETIPLVDAYRNRQARAHRRAVLDATDLFMAATERAREALLLEGVADEHIVVCNPGIDLARFAGAATPATPPSEHVIVSPGRLVWEKGHQDGIRALAATRRGLVDAAAPARRAKLLIVGAGREEKRLQQHAAELGVADAVSIRSAAYDEMPGIFASASALVLASLPSAACRLHPLDIPHCFWEEQFGLVLAEGMAAGVAIIASRSGAIPEVCGDSADYFEPGSWMELAELLAAGPLARRPGERVEHPAARVERYSTGAAADRMAAAYEELLGQRPGSVSKLPT